MKCNLVWIGKEQSQRDWLHYVLGNAIATETTLPAWPEPEPYTLYCLDINWHPLRTLPQEFLQKARSLPGVGLFHSDEWLAEDYRTYRSFAFVMRVHRAAALTGPGILTLPLGWPVGGQATGARRPASARQHSWFFAGNLMASRPEMMRAFGRVPGGISAAQTNVRQTEAPRLPYPAYCELLDQTVFVPAPMGNVVAETWRFYEALEHGCIPIAERRCTLDYYQGLFGPSPVPRFSCWRSAARFVAEMLHSPALLDALQAEIAAWWEAEKARTCAAAQTFLAAGLAGQHRNDLSRWCFPEGWRRDLWQYAELVRHHSPAALGRRLVKAATRRSLRRDMNHLP